MSNITKRLESLKPHVISMRYVQGVPVVDSMFKKGWHVLKNPDISFSKSDEQVGYYMFFSENEEIGFDELLNHIEKIIKYNLDREAKHLLLKEKVEELKVLFKNNTLEDLKELHFVLKEEDTLLPDELEDEISDIPLGEMSEPEIDESEKKSEDNKVVQGVELPPKPEKKLSHKDGECLHDPDEYCDNCMHKIMEA